MTSSLLRVLGIDPGTRVLGFGILDLARGRAPQMVDSGVIRLPLKPLAARLEMIFQQVRRIIAEHAPQVLALEEVFHGKNFQSILKIGEARGVVVLAAQMSGLEIREYSPALIKKAATGNGNASKTQVQRMMQRVLGLEGTHQPVDSTDALAAAFCHGQRLWRTDLPPAKKRAFDRVEAALPSGAASIGVIMKSTVSADVRTPKGDGALLRGFLGKRKARALLRRFRKS